MGRRVDEARSEVNWWLDETPWPGPALQTKEVYVEGYYSLVAVEGFENFRMTLSYTPFGLDINDLIEVVGRDGNNVFMGFLNEIEVEQSFKEGTTETHLTLSNKKIAPSW
jgi:hypothetical protein